MKTKNRYVKVDLGYALAENWVIAKVIEERLCQNLFSEGTEKDLFVEIPGGERLWVRFWE